MGDRGRPAHGGTAAGAAGVPRVLLIDLDPYLCHVVRQRLVTMEVVEVPPDAEPAWFLEATSVASVALVDTASPRLGHVLLARRSMRVIGCARRDDDPWLTADLDAVLVRPFSADEVEDLVTRILDSDGLDTGDPSPPGPPWAVWMARRTSVVYMAAAALAVPFELATGHPTRWLLLALVLALATARTWWHDRRAVAVDILVVTTALMLTGGPASNYVPLAFAVTVRAGLAGSVVAAVRAAAVLALSVVAIPWTSTEPSAIVAIVCYLAVFPALAAATAQSVRLAHLRSQQHHPELVSSRRVRDGLGEAHRRARAGGAHVSVEDAANAILDEVVALGALAGVVLLSGPDGHIEVASTGLLPHLPLLATTTASTPPMHGGPRRLRVPPRGLLACDDRVLAWYEVELRDTGTSGGLLLVGLPDCAPPPDAPAYTQLARRGAVALATAQSLVRLRELAVDRERLDLATQLQDEVGQALVHVRLELELLAAASDDDVGFELQRLVTIVQRHLVQVQATVADLRSTCTPVGLAAALRQYGRDLATLGGPTIRVSSHTRRRLGPATEQGVFDIVRIAMAEACRHVGVTRIQVVLDDVDGDLRVAVEDDGLPVDDPSATQRELVGRLLGRAVTIGAALQALSTPEQGSRVEILCRDPDSYLVMP